MNMRIALVALAMVVAGCNQQAPTSEGGDAAAPQLDAPGQEALPSRVFAPNNDTARTTTGDVTVSVSLRLPDAGQAGADQQEVLTLRGANGLVVEAAITGAVSPATQVQGQTLRALLDIPVEEPQVLVYRVTEETKPEGVSGLCGAEDAAYVVVWEPVSPGASSLKILGVAGGAPGAASSRPCQMLDYRRS